MNWDKNIKMAKEADPTLTDEKAAEVVNDITQLAQLAYECYVAEKRKSSEQK